MKKHLLTAAMLLMSLSLTISSCSKDDNKPADKDKNENTTNGDKTPVTGIYQELTFAELQLADFSGKDEVFLKITDVTNDNVAKIKDYLTTKTNLILAGEVTTIGEYAFDKCYTLQSIKIPNSVTTIGGYAFSWCSHLSAIVIPNSVTTIENFAFSYCDDLQSIIIPNSVTTIGEWAFYDCETLQKVTIKNKQENVTIGENAFKGCPETLEIKYETDDPSQTVEKVTITLADGSTIQVDKDSKYTVSAQNTNNDGFIEKFFVNGEDVSGQEITVSTNIEIAKKVFATITFSDDTKAEVEKGTEYTLPSAQKEYVIYKIADEQFFSGDKITINNNQEISIVAKYQELTFAELQTSDFSSKDEVFLKITDATNDNVVNIKDYLTTKTNLMLSGEVTSIGQMAFFFCPLLQSIEIPNTVTSIESMAFFFSESLQSIEIPNSVTTIGTSAFTGCPLKEVKISNLLTTIEEQVFANCSLLQSVEIPNSVTSIEQAAFKECTSLKKVTIKNKQENVTIEENAFKGCPETLEIKYEPENN